MATTEKQAPAVDVGNGEIATKGNQALTADVETKKKIVISAGKKIPHFLKDKPEVRERVMKTMYDYNFGSKRPIINKAKPGDPPREFTSFHFGNSDDENEETVASSEATSETTYDTELIKKEQARRRRQTNRGPLDQIPSFHFGNSNIEAAQQSKNSVVIEDSSVQDSELIKNERARRRHKNYCEPESFDKWLAANPAAGDGCSGNNCQYPEVQNIQNCHLEVNTDNDENLSENFKELFGLSSAGRTWNQMKTSTPLSAASMRAHEEAPCVRRYTIVPEMSNENCDDTLMSKRSSRVAEKTTSRAAAVAEEENSGEIKRQEADNTTPVKVADLSQTLLEEPDVPEAAVPSEDSALPEEAVVVPAEPSPVETALPKKKIEVANAPPVPRRSERQRKQKVVCRFCGDP